MIIKKGLPEKYKQSAAELLLEAFNEKFIPILGKDKKSIKLIKASIDINNCIYSEKNGNLLGILGITTTKGNFINITFKDLVSIYGLFRAIPKIIKLTMFFFHIPKVNEVYVELVAVADIARGKGIGSMLFDSLTNLALNKGFRDITLQVVDTNPRARELYERLDFVVEKKIDIWPINKLVGWPFREVYYMRKSISFLKIDPG